MTGHSRIAVRVRITGRVQGVWFRGWTHQEARRLGLAGWVRNMPDGSVEALFAGEEAEVETMIGLCHRGPPHARVLKVEAVPVDPPSDLTAFTVER